MRIEQLHYFLDVAQTLSITRSAGNLFISPQGLSQSIASLEKECGFALLDRSKSGISLNEKGKEFKRFAEELCESHQRFENNVAHLMGDVEEQRERFILRLPPLLIVSDQLPALLADLERCHPALAFTVVETNLDQALAEVALEDTDDDFIAIVSVPDFCMDEIRMMKSVQCTCFLEMPVVAKVHRESSLAEKKVFTRHDLSMLPIVCFNEPVMESIVYHLVREFGDPDIVMQGSTDRLLRLRKDAVALSVAMTPTSGETELIRLADTVIVRIAALYRTQASEKTKSVAHSVNRFLRDRYPLHAIEATPDWAH